MDDLISKLSEIRSEYNCFNQDEEPYYRALSEVISILSRRMDGDTISRKAAIDALDKRFDDVPMELTTEILQLRRDLRERIPSAQPDIIRCKDCKHYKTMFCKMDIWHKDITLYRADENDFCSYGERKDG